uniref:Protein SHQ1 homolog n=1 Tax=Oryzias sinensis TaxID=183150 RepID=A0A8C8E140_9TELE
MITPAFELSQDPDFLTLSAHVPFTRTSEFDLFIDGTDLKFYAKPYFLRLTLPGRIVEDGREKATFDIDKGLFTLRIPKETAGEHFQGLQMLTSLLAPRGGRSAKPLVEDLGGECSSNAGGHEEDEEEFDWQVEQQVYTEKSEEELGLLQKYGFANLRCGVFHRLQEELCEVIDLKNPEATSAAERRRARLQAEASAFSSDHYLADLFEDDEIKRLLKFRPWWTKLRVSTEQEEEPAVSFSEEEREQLRRFTNRSYLLDKTSRRQAWLSLVDILLAFCYEVRSTEGEHSVESPWTIRKLSGTLSWLETYSSLQDVLVSFGRRVSCFPLYRHFALVTSAIRDAAKIFQSGPRRWDHWRQRSRKPCCRKKTWSWSWMSWRAQQRWCWRRRRRRSLPAAPPLLHRRSPLRGQEEGGCAPLSPGGLQTADPGAAALSREAAFRAERGVGGRRSVCRESTGAEPSQEPHRGDNRTSCRRLHPNVILLSGQGRTCFFFRFLHLDVLFVDDRKFLVNIFWLHLVLMKVLELQMSAVRRADICQRRFLKHAAGRLVPCLNNQSSFCSSALSALPEAVALIEAGKTVWVE